MEKLINQSDVNYFLSEIKRMIPSFVAGILCDRHGFMIGSKVPQDFHIQENILALSAISNRRDFIEENGYLKVKTDLDKSKDIKLMVLLEKSHKNIANFKKLRKLIETQGLF